MLQSKKAFVQKRANLKRFDLACILLFPGISRKKIKAIIDTGGAFLNKKRIKIAKYIVKNGDVIELYWDDKQKKKIPLKKEDIIFENEDFLVINKPAGVPVQGTLESDRHTILYALQALDEKKYPPSKLFLVHRLDKETSGLMILAKKTEVQKEFEGMFREHKIQKTYKAFCYFTPKDKAGLIQYPIAKDVSRKNTYFAVTTSKKYPNQKPAETRYVVKKTYPHGVALVLCTPTTGRTHQIRVHLAAIGCPIVGDKTYAQNIYGHPYSRTVLRHLLHASRLEFCFHSKKYEFESDFESEDVKNIIKH